MIHSPPSTNDSRCALGRHGVFGVGIRQLRAGRQQIIPNVTSALPMYSWVFSHGAMDITVDGASVAVQPNTLFIWDRSCRVFYGRSETRWVISWLQCLPPLFDALPGRAELPLNQPLVLRDAQLVDRFFWLLYDEFRNQAQPDAAIVENAVTGIALAVRREMRADPATPLAKIPAPLQEARAYLEKNFQQRITLTTLAQRAAMAPAYFSRRFKDCFGVGPIDWLIEQRLAEAATYLQATDLQVQEIAGRVGYVDIYSFSKAFRKRYGQAPLAFRRRGALAPPE